MIVNAALASALASALVPIVTCMAAGSAVGCGNSRWPGADMLVGLGLVGGVLTVLAVATSIPLSGLMTALAVVPIIALAIRREIPSSSTTWIALALVSPILVIAAGSQAALYDEFWHWLPSAAYAFNHDSLVKLGLPPSFSHSPAYPQAMPLMIAAASLVAGRFLEAAGPIINVSLLAGVSAVLADAVTAALERRGRLAATSKLFLVASAVAVTIPLDPGLIGSVVFSSYADCGTMVAVGALGLIGVEILARVGGRGPGAENLSWRFGFVGALLVNLKQANPVLLASITAGLAVVALRDPAIERRRALAQLPRMLGPAIMVFVVWHWYVMRNVVPGEAAFRPFNTWNFSSLPITMTAIWKHITGMPLFHAMMWSITAVGFAAFFRLPRKANEAQWLAVVCATVWLGYNAFLVAVYLGAFNAYDGETATDYWRYTPHVALLALYVPVMALATGPWPTWMSLRGVMPALMATVAALCTLPARSDLRNPAGRALPRFIRHVTTDIRHALPPGSKVAIIQCWSGSPFGVMVRYDLWQLDAPGREIYGTIVADTDDGPDPEVVAGLATRGEANYLLIQDAECEWDKEDTDKIALSPINHEFALFAWRNDAWEKMKSWPIPPALIYRDP